MKNSPILGLRPICGEPRKGSPSFRLGHRITARRPRQLPLCLLHCSSIQGTGPEIIHGCFQGLLLWILENLNEKGEKIERIIVNLELMIPRDRNWFLKYLISKNTGEHQSNLP